MPALSLATAMPQVQCTLEKNTLFSVSFFLKVIHFYWNPAGQSCLRDGSVRMIWFSLWAQRRSPHSSPHTLFMVTSRWSPKKVSESPASSPGDYQAQMKDQGLSIWPLSAPLDSVWSYFFIVSAEEKSSLHWKTRKCLVLTQSLPTIVWIVDTRTVPEPGYLSEYLTCAGHHL